MVTRIPPLAEKLRATASSQQKTVRDYHSAQARIAIEWCSGLFCDIADEEKRNWGEFPHVAVAIDNLKKKIRSVRVDTSGS